MSFAKRQPAAAAAANEPEAETSETIEVSKGAIEVIGSFVISANKLFSQAQGVPPDLVELGNQAQAALKEVAAPDQNQG